MKSMPVQIWWHLALLVTVSPLGVHIAKVVAQGSRMAVSVDGVIGPKFDEILSTGGSSADRVAFSTDGARYAYLARLGQELVAIVDGKEFLRVPVSSTFPPLPGGEPNPGFTAGGKHAYAFDHTQKSMSTGENYFNLIVDGQAGPNSGGAFWPSFSLEGSRIAYIITNPMNRQQTALVVDGKPAGYPAGGLANVGGSGYEPRFTPDGTHLLVYGMAPGALQVLIDGRPFLKAPDAHLFMTPAGNAFVTRITGMDRVSFLDIGGRKVPGSEGQGIDSVYFNADGKKGLEYQSIPDIGFSGDGRVIYVAANAGKTFVVAGDHESDGYQGIQSFMAPPGRLAYWVSAGRHIGYIAQNGGTNQAVVDGKAIPRPMASDLVLSPDGARFAFAFQGGANVDGVDDPSSKPVPAAGEVRLQP